MTPVLPSGCAPPDNDDGEQTQRIPEIVVEEVPHLVVQSTKSDPARLGAELITEVASHVPSSRFLYSTYPSELNLPEGPECFFFRTQVRGQTVHALADTGASENFVSAPLAAQLGLIANPRKQRLSIRIADGSTQECTHFVRVTIRIGDWVDRMAFVILPYP